MDELIYFITGGAETFTPEMIVRFIVFLMGIECVASIIKSLMKGVN